MKYIGYILLFLSPILLFGVIYLWGTLLEIFSKVGYKTRQFVSIFFDDNNIESGDFINIVYGVLVLGVVAFITYGTLF